MKKIAIIPARSGSKGIINKNIINLCGKPLIAYTIESALKSNEFDSVIVSTDSIKYAEISKQYGANVLIRDENISGDTSPTYYVIEDVLKKYNSFLDYFVLLQPTSPLRTAKNIIEACCIFENNYLNNDFLVSMCESSHSSILINQIDEDRTLKYFDKDFSNYSRHQYKEYYPNGAIFIGKIDEYLKQKHFFGSKAISYIMDDIHSVDIDNKIDLLFAETLLKEKLI